MTQDELDQTLDQFKEQFGDKPSERHPARTDLIVLVAHNDDPTGNLSHSPYYIISISIKFIRYSYKFHIDIVQGYSFPGLLSQTKCSYFSRTSQRLG